VTSTSENWVWIQFIGLPIPLRGTPANNPITFISQVHWGAAFFAADSLCVALQIFQQFYPKARNANPLDVEHGPDFNAKWPFKVIQGHLFRRQWRATKGLHEWFSQFVNFGARLQVNFVSSLISVFFAGLLCQIIVEYSSIVCHKNLDVFCI